MADEKKKAIENDQETIKPAGSRKPGDELSEEDLKKAAGGAGTDLNIGKVIDKTTPW
ncbi:MAG: hypothetical protein ABSF45_10205 [Terriglobia bacterium]|jgi:hypothetical protein